MHANHTSSLIISVRDLEGFLVNVPLLRFAVGRLLLFLLLNLQVKLGFVIGRLVGTAYWNQILAVCFEAGSRNGTRPPSTIENMDPRMVMKTNLTNVEVSQT